MLMRRQSYNQNKLFSRLFFMFYVSKIKTSKYLMLTGKIHRSMFANRRAKKFSVLTSNVKVYY